MRCVSYWCIAFGWDVCMAVNKRSGRYIGCLFPRVEANLWVSGGGFYRTMRVEWGISPWEGIGEFRLLPREWFSPCNIDLWRIEPFETSYAKIRNILVNRQWSMRSLFLDPFRPWTLQNDKSVDTTACGQTWHRYSIYDISPFPMDRRFTFIISKKHRLIHYVMRLRILRSTSIILNAFVSDAIHAKLTIEKDWYLRFC